MKIVDKAVKKVYRFNCPNCQSRLEGESKEFEDIGGKISKFFCPVCKKDRYITYQKLYDNGYRTYGDVLDSSDAPITDSNLDTVIGRTYSSDLLRDSNGDVIEGRAIFVIK